MKISKEELIEEYKSGKVTGYEDELIEKLRDIDYKGIPLSIILLCHPLCDRQCYAMSMNITRGMEHFLLVRGDINELDLNEDGYPNHGWVEKDGFVYDTTFGIKWEKDLYYKIFEPNVKEIIDEKSINDYPDYQELLMEGEGTISPMRFALILQYIEALENEDPQINHQLLERELQIVREKRNITYTFSNDEVEKFKQIIKTMNESTSNQQT